MVSMLNVQWNTLRQINRHAARRDVRFKRKVRFNVRFMSDSLLDSMIEPTENPEKLQPQERKPKESQFDPENAIMW